MNFRDLAPPPYASHFGDPSPWQVLEPNDEEFKQVVRAARGG